MLVSGNVTIRATSNDFVGWQLFQEDGVTPIDISAATLVTLRLEKRDDNAVTEFKTSDIPQKLFITDATNGKVELRPASDDFPVKSSYKFHIIYTDSAGDHPVPENIDYTFQVIDDYAP